MSTAPTLVVSPRTALTLARSSAEDFGAVPREARRWFMLAVGSLVVAGLLSLAVVIGRLPGLSRWIDDPLFFKRCLVVHVNLALVVWFYAFLAGLGRLRSGRIGGLGSIAFFTSVAGLGAMLTGAAVRGAQPVLANYVPVIDHPLFLGGLAAFFLGAAVFLVATLGSSARRLPAGMSADAAVGLQSACVAFALAGATWIATRASLPDGLETWTKFEFSAWGAGHVLQVANAAAMLSVWLWLAARATGQSVVSVARARVLFTLLIAPHFAMPLLTARGALNPLYHSGATQLMRWGVFPLVTIALGLVVRHLIRHPLETRDPFARAARAGLIASMALTTLGFVLGACIRSSTTLVPAHYHASLGGVTVAFMAAAYLVGATIRAERRAIRASAADAARRQLALFGVGQTVFALGFAIGGAYGLGRKTYAAEQHLRSAGEIVGLGVMGVGGLVAAAAGLWFLFLILREMRTWLSVDRSPAELTP